MFCIEGCIGLGIGADITEYAVVVGMWLGVPSRQVYKCLGLHNLLVKS